MSSVVVVHLLRFTWTLLVQPVPGVRYHWGALWSCLWYCLGGLSNHLLCATFNYGGNNESIFIFLHFEMYINMNNKTCMETVKQRKWTAG